MGAEHAPAVSIGLPVHNGGATLRSALDSLLAQSHRDFELIISDNASTDETDSLCREYARRDPRIRLYRNGRNRGAVDNFKMVLERGRSEYFMWAAADDIWRPDFIRVLLEEMKSHPGAGVAMCSTERSYPDGRPFDTVRFTGRANPNGRSSLARLFQMLSPQKHNLFIYGLYRKDFLDRAMREFPDILGSDRLFLCQIALAAPLRYVDQSLYLRTHQPTHEQAYREMARRSNILAAQMRILARQLFRSRVIPAWRKFMVPLAVARCALWFYSKAHLSGKLYSRLGRFLRRGV
jgi:glycosyltransferase involved in cell wall biosynthesis